MKLQKRWVWYGGGLVFYLLVIASIVQFEARADGNIKSFGDGLWYAIVTLSTVGYGDYYPVTTPGRLLGLSLIIGSISILGVLVAEITGYVNSYLQKQKLGMLGTKFTNHFVIIGWDEFARYVVDQLVQVGTPVAVICDKQDTLELLQSRYSKEQVFVLFADYGDYGKFEKAGLARASKVWINNGADAEKLIMAVNLRKHYQNIELAMALDAPDLKDTFKAAGVTYIISKNEITGRLMASYLFEPDVALYSEDLLHVSRNDSEYDIQQYRVTAVNPFAGEDYSMAFYELKKRYNAILMGLSRPAAAGGREILKNPEDKVVIEPGNYLLLMSDGKAKKALQEDFGVKEGV